MATVLKPLYVASAAITIAPENAPSATAFDVGVESTAVLNFTDRLSDALVSGKWTAGTTPVALTQVQIWVYAPISDDLASGVVWPSVIDGVASAETFTSGGLLRSGLKLGATIDIDVATSNVTYACAPFSVAELFGGRLPSRWGLYIAHNTGVNANATAGNHAWSYVGVRDMSDAA